MEEKLTMVFVLRVWMDGVRHVMDHMEGRAGSKVEALGPHN